MLFTYLAALALAAPQQGAISESFLQRSHLSFRATTSECENHPGPYITIDGALTLSGVDARIILTNNKKFTHVTSADVVADVTLVPVGDQIKIAKPPVLGGVGGNPWFYLQFSDGYKSYGKPKLLGRCVQGLDPVELDFGLPTSVTASAETDGCTNSGGPNVSLNGELRLGGLMAHLILTNNAKFTHVTSADVVVDIVIIPEGESLVFHKQPPLGGAGGNPWIYLQFMDGMGNELTPPALVGRCNRL